MENETIPKETIESVKIEKPTDIIDLIVKVVFVKYGCMPNTDLVLKIMNQYYEDPKGKDYFVFFDDDGELGSKFLSETEIVSKGCLCNPKL
jgi:hypothetical protein